MGTCQSCYKIKMSCIWWTELNYFEVGSLSRLNANPEVNFRNVKDHRDHVIKCSHFIGEDMECLRQLVPCLKKTSVTY